jgi:hypothetical protein
VLIHLKPPPFFRAIATTAKRPISRQRRIAVSAASLCYAKITPAALQRGEFGNAGRAGAEAAVGNPKFGSSGCRRLIAGSPAPVAQAHRWHRVEQGMPDA